MATTTSNFGWAIPQSTDLVKDGATAIAALGNGVDTSMAQLKGGTTGQILSKTSSTDMAFTWTTPNPGDITGVTAGTGITGGGTSGDVTITNSMATAIDAKGDLIAGTGADAFSRLAVGTDYAFLQALSSESTGLNWRNSWTDWTPTLTNLTLGNGSLIANYFRVGKLVTFYVRFTLGSTSSVGTDPRFTLPFSANRTLGPIFSAKLTDDGVADYNGVGLFYTDSVYVRTTGASGTYANIVNTTATVPFTWGANDYFVVTGTYEAA